MKHDSQRKSVGLKNCAGDKAFKREIQCGFETLGRRHQKSKTRVLVAPQKGHVSAKYLKKNVGAPSVRSVSITFLRNSRNPAQTGQLNPPFHTFVDLVNRVVVRRPLIGRCLIPAVLLTDFSR